MLRDNLSIFLENAPNNYFMNTELNANQRSHLKIYFSGD